jgi:hypothetical protein
MSFQIRTGQSSTNEEFDSGSGMLIVIHGCNISWSIRRHLSGGDVSGDVNVDTVDVDDKDDVVDDKDDKDDKDDETETEEDDEDEEITFVAMFPSDENDMIPLDAFSPTFTF